MYRQGLSVGVWIWIIGGVAVAALILLAFFTNITQESCTQIKRNQLSEFNAFRDTVDLACSSATGYRAIERLSFKTGDCGARAIYTANEKRNVDLNYQEHIVEQRRSSGSHICISFSEQNFQCFETGCQINATYTGMPYEGSDMYEVGITDNAFTYKFTVTKDKYSFVNISAQHIP